MSKGIAAAVLDRTAGAEDVGSVPEFIPRIVVTPTRNHGVITGLRVHLGDLGDAQRLFSCGGWSQPCREGTGYAMFIVRNSDAVIDFRQKGADDLAAAGLPADFL